MSEEILFKIILWINDNKLEAEITPESLVWAVWEFDAQRNRERLRDPEYKALLALTPEKTSSDASSTEVGGQNA